MTTGVLLVAVALAGGSQVVVLVGAISSWISAVPVNDVKLADRRLTTLLIPVPAIGGLLLGAAATGDIVREDAVFLAVVFTAVYIRRFGQRYLALGVVAVFAYFFALFVAARPQEVPAYAGAVITGTIATYVMRFVLFPKHARGSLWWVMQAILAQLRIALDRSREETAPRGSDRPVVIIRNLARVNETMLAVQEQGVVAGAYDGLAFRCELAAENLIVALMGEGADSGVRAEAEREMSAAMEEVRRAATSAAADPETSSPQRDAILKEAQRGGASTQYGLRPTTRQAIQVTAAAAGAIVLGEHISAQRWYWAVITAFIVFSGTTSAGETLARAWAGFLGTSIGVAAGAVAGVFVQRDVVLESWLLFFSMLFAAYFLKLGFGVASFFVTMMLVMLYELLGRFTDQVLLVRVLEILAGAACGGLAATVLLPTSTKMIFRADARAALQALRDALDVMASADAVEAQSAVRRCDAAVRRLRTRVDPLHSGPTFAGASLFARRWLRDVELCAYYARNAVCAPRDGADLALRAHEANVEADAILGAIDADESWPRPSSPAPAPEIPQFAQGPAEAFSDRIRVMLQRLRGTFTQPPAL